MTRGPCPLCRKRPIKAHGNSKWCSQCAKELRRRPRHTLTAAQQKKACALRGKYPAKEVAARVGCTVVNLRRFATEQRLSFSAWPYANNRRLVAQVLAYYARHGVTATQKGFPKVSVRSIVERYQGGPVRQVRWTSPQIVDAVRMACFVPFRQQAKQFARPGANAGSIRKLWSVRMKLAPSQMHGLPEHMAKFLCRPSCRMVTVRAIGPARSGATRRVALWCEAERHLKAGVPMYLRKGIRAMAQFQRWLYGTPDPVAAILRILAGGAPTGPP